VAPKVGAKRHHTCSVADVFDYQTDPHGFGILLCGRMCLTTKQNPMVFVFYCDVDLLLDLYMHKFGIIIL
jgi:hypothetical protein